MVEWSCTKERLNEREPYISVEWSCAIKRNNSVGTLNFGQMVVHIASSKIMEREGSISPYSFYGNMLDCSVCNFLSMNSPMELIVFSQNSFVISPGLLHDLYVKFYCFSETIAYGLKITNYINHTFSVLYIQSMSSS